MPAVTDEVEEVVEEEVLEDENENESSTETSKRPRLNDDNTYYFPVSKDQQDKKTLHKLGKEAQDSINGLTYKDGSPVKEGFRVFEIIKDAEYDDDSGERTAGTVVAHVLGRSSQNAAEFFLLEKNYSIDLAFKKKRRGRAKTKINATVMDYGKLLAQQIFQADNPRVSIGEDPKYVPNANENYIKDFEANFSPSGPYGHYLEENGDWKSPPSEEE